MSGSQFPSDVFLWLLDQIAQSLAAIRTQLAALQTAISKGFAAMSGSQQQFQQELDQLKQAAANETSVTQGVVLVVNTFAQKLQDALNAAAQNAGVNQQQLADMQAVIDSMTQNAGTLGQLVQQNTPAASNTGSSDATAQPSSAPSGSGTG